MTDNDRSYDMSADIETTTYRGISSVQLADVLVKLVTADIRADAERFGNVTSWNGLHEVCDANDYLADAARQFFGGDSWEHDEAVVAWESDGVALAESVIWTKGVG